MNDLKQKLQHRGYKFDFFQAIKLLENAHKDRPEIGHIGPFKDEIIKITPNNSLSFAASDVNRIELEQDDYGNEKWHIFENFLGLYGPNTASPIFIAESINQCLADDDPMREFFDIFNHRLLSLYYRAFKRSNLMACVSSQKDDSITRILFALIGHDFSTSTDEWAVNPNRFLRFGNLLSGGGKSAAGLEKIIANYFSIRDVRIIQFTPRRVKFDESNVSRITATGTGGNLGESIVLGDTVVDITGQFTIHLGLRTLKRFHEFQPGKPKFKELIFLTRMYVQNRLDFSLELSLSTNEIQSVKLANNSPNSEMGLSSWLGSPKEKETVVTIDVNPDD